MTASRRIGHGPGVPGLVSVVITSYNRGYIVGKSIESALGQTYPNIEILVADDGSTDDTRTVVESYGDPVRWLWQPNAGLAGARNLGLQHARGEYIALLDSDDEWLPWKLEAQVALMQCFSDLALVWTDMTAVTAEGRVVEERHLRTMYTAYQAIRAEEIMRFAGTLGELWPNAPESLRAAPFMYGDLFLHLLHGSLVQPSTVLMRRSHVQKLGHFDPASAGGEDYDFYMKLSAHGPMGLLDVPSMLYRIGSPDQLTAPGGGIALARAALRSVREFRELNGELVDVEASVFERRIGDILAWLGEEELGVGDAVSARRHLWDALRRRRRARTVLLLAAAYAPASLLARLRRARAWLRRLTRQMTVTANA